MYLTDLFIYILKLSLMGSIVAGIIIIIKRLFGDRLPVHWHYYIWFLLIVRLIVPFNFESSLKIPHMYPSFTTDLKNVAVESQISNQTNSTENQEFLNIKDEKNETLEITKVEQNKSNNTYLSFLSILWVIGAMSICLFMLSVNIHFNWKLLKKSKCDDLELLTLLKECKTKLKMRSKVHVIYADKIGTPSISGIFQPKIIISKGLLESLSKKEKMYVLLHELTHLKRYDIFIHWMIIIIQAIYWFNPLIWYSFYKMRKDCELSCDASVLSRLEGNEYTEYGNTIISVLEKVSKPTLIPRSIGMSANKSDIKSRIWRIKMFKKRSWVWVALSCMLALGIGVLGFTTFEKRNSNQLISYYETIKLENAIESSINKNVFKKKGHPDGYDLTLSREKKEVILVIRPYSKKNFNYLKVDLQSNIEEVLKTKKYRDYKVKVLAYWNDTNQTERQKREEKIIQEVANEMKQIHKIDVSPGTSYSATDGRIVDMDLSFHSNGKEITNPKEINNLHKEFIDLAKEKGFNENNIPTYFIEDWYRNWGKNITPAIDQGLKEIKDLKVTSTTIFHYNEPIIINTSINSSDTKANEIGERIESLVNEFLEYNEINKSYPGPYEVHVLSENNKKIN
ncbi:M56 family metallopeptidase [Peribacillus simplex]|uniref:M56 family metallopeptidase n=1 Tax=Peribacillus simplex TaxID=1478 RepID=UPI003D2A577B